MNTAWGHSQHGVNKLALPLQTHCILMAVLSLSCYLLIGTKELESESLIAGRREDQRNEGLKFFAAANGINTHVTAIACVSVDGKCGNSQFITS
jgi:hypothetical protein